MLTDPRRPSASSSLPRCSCAAGAAPWTSEGARMEGAEKSVETMLQWVYLMHELDEAADKISKNQLSASSGE